jgi:hypothetical protein
MPEETQEVTNTEVADEEEIVTDNDLNGEDQEEEEDEDPRDLKIKELEEKNQKLYQKLKSGYKKGKETREAIKEGYVSKDDVKKIVLETQNEIRAEQDFISTYEDAKDFLPEIKKVMAEDKISIDKAYALIKGKMQFDDGYRNQLMQYRTNTTGNITKSEVGSYRYIFEGKKTK